MKSYLLALSLGVACAALVPGTSAARTGSAEVGGARAAARTADLEVQDVDQVRDYTALDTATMSPGASVAGVLTVRNNGGVPLEYFVDSAATNRDGKDLAGALTVKVTAAPSVSGLAPHRTCAGTPVRGSRTSFGPALVGSGDHPRLLAPGASETLCVQASLPPYAPTVLGAASTAVRFVLPAATVRRTVWADTVQVSGTRISTGAAGDGRPASRVGEPEDTNLGEASAG